MTSALDTILLTTAFGAAVFALAALALLSAAAERSVQHHMTRVRAMQLRNAYLRTVLAMRKSDLSPEPAHDTAADAPETNTPPAPAGRISPEVPDTSEPPDQRTAAA